MISQILKMLIFKKDIRTTQVAREINMPQQTLQRIVAGLSPSPHRKTLVPLAEFFSISVDQLIGEKPLPDELSSASVTQTTSVSAQQQVPLVECADVELFLKNHDASLVKEYLESNGAPSKDTFAKTLVDSSMEPYFPQGAILILNMKKSPSEGAMC